MDCQNGLRVSKIVFFSGIGVWLVGIIIGAITDALAVIMVSAVLCLGIMFGGIYLAIKWVRCPHCGGSLMLGGLIPGSLPNYCPHCGEKL